MEGTQRAGQFLSWFSTNEGPRQKIYLHLVSKFKLTSYTLHFETEIKPKNHQSIVIFQMDFHMVLPQFVANRKTQLKFDFCT